MADRQIGSRRQSGTARVSFHAGNVVNRAVASTYPTLLAVVLELIQNALDAFEGVRKSDKNKVEVVIDVKQGFITSADNGNGCSRRTFREVVKKIGESIKSRGQMGEFGFGLFSPIGKCGEYTFTSIARDDKRRLGQRGVDGYLLYDFTPLIKSEEAELEIPEYNQDRFDREPPWWNTFTRMKRVDRRKLRQLRLADIVSEASTKFAHALEKRGVIPRIVYVNEEGQTQTALVEPQPFKGRKLPEVTLKGESCGRVRLQLFISEATGNPLFVRVDGGDYRVSWKDFSRLDAVKAMRDEVVETLSAGYLGGEIIVQNAEYTADRHGLVEDDRLYDLLTIVDDWTWHQGRDLVDGVRASKEADRRTVIGRRALRLLRKLRDQNPQFAALCAAFRNALISPGHTGVGKLGEEGTGVGTRKPPGEGKRPSGGGTRGLRGENAGQEHDVTEGNGGGKQAAKDQIGIRLSYEEDFGASRRHFNLDLTRGVVAINTSSTDYGAVWDSDKVTKQEQYVLTILMLCISVASLPEDARPAAIDYAETFFSMKVMEILQGESMMGGIREAFPVTTES
jgi:hypothetical protein